MEYLSGPTVDKVVERHLTGKKGGKKGTNIDSMKKKKKNSVAAKRHFIASVKEN